MALPAAITYTMATRDTGDDISQQKPLVISDNIWMNDPRENQFLGWVLRQGVKEPTPNHVFGHLEDVAYPNWVKYVGATETTGKKVEDFDFEAGTGARLTIYSRLYNPRTGEVMILTADMDTDILSDTITRAWGQTWATSMWMHTNDKLLILTPNQYEGYTTGEAISSNMVFKSFNTEIINYPVRVTDTEYAEVARGGNPFVRALNKSWKQTKDQMESGLIFGCKNSTTITSGAPIRASEGLVNYISTNVWALDGYMTRQDLWDILAEWTSLNKGGGAIVCSKAFKHMVTGWAFQKVQYNQETKKDGMEIQQILTPDGIFDLVEVDLFNQHPDLMGRILLVPTGLIKYRPLVGYKNLDVKYTPINRDNVHVEEGEIAGEYGWEFFTEEKFGTVTGIQF